MITTIAEAEREGQFDGGKRAITRFLTTPQDLDYFASSSDTRVAMSLDLLALGRRVAQERQADFGKRESRAKVERMEAYAKGFKHGALQEIWKAVEMLKLEVQ